MRDMFRKRDFGGIEVEANSHSMTSDFYVDTSRIGTHEQWEPSTNPGKPGRVVQVRDSLMDSARRGCDALKHRSSLRDESAVRDISNGPCCFYDDGRGPLTKRRGDD